MWKKTYLRQIIFSLLLFHFSFFFAPAQTADSPAMTRFEFIDQDIRDILYTFSTYAKISIIADDTVSGIASFQFSGTSFEQAFDTFLMSNRLYVEKKPDLWIVSRILITINEDSAVTLNALDASPVQLLEKLSSKSKKTIIQDMLPSARLSLNIENASVIDTVRLIMNPFSDYTVTDGDSYIQVKRNPIEAFPPASSFTSGTVNIHESNGMFDVSIEQAQLGDILDNLFLAARREYTSFARSGQIIERLHFSGKSFPETLTLILEQANGEAKEINGMWYVFPLQQNEIIRRLQDSGKTWRHFELKHISLDEFMSLLQGRFPGTQTLASSGSGTFLAFVDNNVSIELQNYIKTIDVSRRSTPIKLKYIRTEDLMSALPPSVSASEIIDAGDGNTFFYLGSPERLAVFMEDLRLIDRPQPRIRYDLLIIQYQDTSDLNWDISLDARQMKPGDMTMVTGRLGNLLNLNFDAISVFGYQFAAKINAAISDNQASVFADTTLFGLSGQEIKFQNTSTYRYRDSNINPETGAPIYSGVTREIISGLQLDISGWVSGDGMITTTVTASISKRGADVSTSSGSPPPTYEKILTTQVRAFSGETVVLSGLRQNDTTIVEERTPLLSKIPFLGWLFKNRNSRTENTQMIIYLVPHVDIAETKYTAEGLKTASIYERFVIPFLEQE